MKKVILLGLIAAFFFSNTFVINRWLNVEKNGHWYWTATLRYVYVFIFISLMTFISKGPKVYKQVIDCYLSFWHFWVFAGGVGFGLFYLALCFAASYSPGWVLATTWQLTILMTPVVIFLLGEKVPYRGIIYLLIMFTGILLVNYDEFAYISQIELNSIIPIAIAAFCYPLGNTLCKYACRGKYSKIGVNKFPASNNIFNQILMMTMGALPVLGIAWISINPPPPTIDQLYSTALIAILTGLIATGLFYQARKMSGDDSLKLSAVDGTQAAEAPLALFWEWLLFNGALPSEYGFLGLSFVVAGIFLFCKHKKSVSKE